MKKSICLICLLWIGVKLQAQDSCIVLATYDTNMVGNDQDSLGMTLKFLLKKDSVIILSPATRGVHQTPFKILHATCDSKVFSGRTLVTYKLLMQDKDQELYPLFNILLKDQAIQRVELLYENSEKRIFWKSN